ncbi:MAG TPA: hypothetical protein VGY56_19690 [Verrucomicrobiae bacterium]|nr:hypothetical protein [Verrucomicrobiae bacterium]
MTVVANGSLRLAAIGICVKKVPTLKKFLFIALLFLLALRSLGAGAAVGGEAVRAYGDLEFAAGNLPPFLYNTENQLTNVFVPSQWRSDFAYDGLGRRRIVREYKWSGDACAETNEVHYIYDGHLPIQERDSNNNVLVTYTRGLDLSDSLEGAGGIGACWKSVALNFT